jgi:hypothetical protein
VFMSSRAVERLFHSGPLWTLWEIQRGQHQLEEKGRGRHGSESDGPYSDPAGRDRVAAAKAAKAHGAVSRMTRFNSFCYCVVARL